MRRSIPAIVAGAAALAVAVALAARPRGPAFVAADHVEGASALAGNFVNFGVPREARGVFHAAADPADPVRTFHWDDEATLERGLRELLAEAETRRLDGSRTEGGRRAALDLVFASTHSERVVVPGADGVQVGEIRVDRSRLSPARAGMLAVLARVAAAETGQYTHVRVHTVFLLNCGSVEDHGDHAAIDRAVRTLTGAPPARILATSDKVNPDYRDVCAGFATGNPFTLFDCRPDGDAPRAIPVLHVGRDGKLNFGTGRGAALAVPPTTNTD